ncbi:MAG TPA: cupin domain-containing protein [Planctomycetota bacterium]|nr:cupin domain-containing protein [Planctomycetota bacterium]
MFCLALRALPAGEVADAEAQLRDCPDCQRAWPDIRALVEAMAAWPTDVLRPATDLWSRIAPGLGGTPATEPPPVPAGPAAPKPQWEVAAPGIYVKILARDEAKKSVSMLVRLDPKTSYPPHRHAGVEELHLLHGELIVDEKLLRPGDYIHAVAGSEDHRVYSETGCTCVLMTSTEDAILKNLL